MVSKPPGPTRRRSSRENYKPQPLIDRIMELIAERNESKREAALGAGLDHQSINRIRSGQRPSITTCVLFADHFEINPNELIILAGWPRLKVFDIHTESAENLPPEAVEVAMDVAKIPDPGVRKEVAQAIRTLLAQYFDESA
ncbi:MAG: helix-turn-helix transcriptional regulator [Chloroflexota bacterium]|nr:helix-turn-helix transcriptional regulator [Chloroflexota bacterium]